MKKLSILFVLIFLARGISINAQSLDFQWAKSAGGGSWEYGESIATDASGNVYVTGYFYSASLTFGTYTLTSAGSDDMYIVKYDPAGNVLWAKCAGGSGADRGNDIATDASGNTYVTGYFGSPSITFGTYTLVNAGIRNMYIVKYDPAGNVLWAKSSAGSGGGAVGNGIMTDASGNIYVTGDFESTSITFGTYTLTSNASGYMFVVKYDSAGNVLWAKSAAGSGGASTEVIGNSITTDASGNIYVTGTFRATSVTFGTYTLTNSNTFYEDIFIVKYDPSGNVFWAKRAGGNYVDYAKSITTDAFGNVYITGCFYSASITFGTYTLSNSGSSGADIYIVKYDPNGNLLWAKREGGGSTSNDDSGKGITMDNFGNVYITGYFNSLFITFGAYALSNSASAGFSEIFIVKYDPAGNVLWAKSAGGSNHDSGNAIAMDDSGNAYITGFFRSPSISFATNTITNVSDYDMFVAKLSNVRLGNCSCFGLCNGSATITLTGTAGTYTTSLSNGVTSSANPAVFSGLCAGSYSYSATDGTNTATGQFIISQPTALTAIIAPPPSTICQGSCENLYATASGGTIPYTYNWSPTIGAGSSINICPSTTSVYSVTVNDANGCPALSTATVTVIPSPTVSVGSGSIVCSGTSVSLTAAGANTYTWNTGATTNSITETPGTTTNYTVTGTDANNCIGTATTQITVNPNPVINVNNGTICEGQSFTITPSGANTYTYSGGSDVVSPNVSTSYTITGEDSNNCIGTATTQIIVNPNPTVTIASNSVCVGTSASLTASGANSYTWNTGSTTNSITETPTITTTYSVTGADLNNCSNTQTVSITVDNTCADVWPGDANSDGIVDNLDVLELGLHYTQTGLPRASVSNAWQSYHADNWTGTITNGKNINHSNCNGDGIINDDDTLAIYNNYGLTHAFKATETNTVNPQLTIVPDQAMLAKGTWGSSSIYLGDASNAMSNLNGAAFTAVFDNTLIETDSVYIEYQNSFIGLSTQNLKFSKPDFTIGKIYTAITHTLSSNVSGYGKIATLHYKIKSNLAIDAPLNLSLIQANQSDASGAITPLSAGSATLMAIGASVGLNEISNNNLIAIQPNPSNGMIVISSTTEIEKIEVLSLAGQILISEKVNSKTHQLNLENLANGVYFVKVYNSQKHVSIKKLVVQR